MSNSTITGTAPSGQSFRNQLADRRRRGLSDIIATLRLLPTTVTVPMRILQLQRSGTAGMAEFGEAVGADPSLASKILGLANSASFSPGRPVTRVTEAVGMIGMKNLLSLVFGVSISGIFNKLGLPPAEAKSLWKASLLKAIAAREYAALEAPDLAEEAFICGLVQDIGLPVIYANDPSAWPETSAIMDLDADSRREREQAMYGTDHAQVGRLVAAKLGLPEMYQLATGFHHGGVEALGGTGNRALTTLARALDLAASLRHRVSSGDVSASRLAQLPQLKAFPGALQSTDSAQNSSRQAQLPKAICTKYAGTLQLLGEKDESSADFKQFLQALCGEVAGCLEMAIAESNSQISNLKARESDLVNKISGLKQHVLQSDYDTLTTALNRRGFVARADRFFALAREYQTGCAIGFVDVDNFKDLNDRHGHATGDEGLKLVSDRLADAVRGRGIVGRVGGDEFAFLIVVRSQPELGTEAERLSVSLKDMRVAAVAGAAGASGAPLAGPGDVSMTASIGLLWIGIPKPEQTLDTTLKSADALMYGAKRAGKARCVVGQID